MAQDKIRTGITGIDHLLKGGLLPNDSVMIEGTPGTGKSTLALQFIAEGVRLGEPGVFVTLEEYPAELYRDALSFGWDFRQWERENKVRLIATSPQALKEQLEKGGPLTEEIHTIGAKRIVVDSVSQFERISVEPMFLRATLGSLVHAFKMEGLISVFTKDVEATTELSYWGRYTVDVLIELSFLLMKDRERHRLVEIHKARGQNYILGRHTFKILENGIIIFPRPVTESLLAVKEKEASPAAARVSSGIKELDAMLGGGYLTGQTVLIAGSAGTGKSLAAASFAASDEHGALYISLEDPPARIIQNAAAVGIDLLQLIRSDQLELLYLPPVELTPDELLYEVESRLDTGRFRRLIIDTISILRGVTPEPEYLRDIIYAISNACFSRGVTGMLTAEIEEVTGPFRFTDFGGSFIADTVVLLRLVEVSGEMKKSISVIKMRGSKHDRSLRELSMTDRGLTIGPAFENLAGLLTGVPTAQRSLGFEPYFGEVTPEQQRVVSALSSHRDATAEDIADATGLGFEHTRELLGEMVKMGFITAVEAEGKTHYRAALMKAR